MKIHYEKKELLKQIESLKNQMKHKRKQMDLYQIEEVEEQTSLSEDFQ